MPSGNPEMLSFPLAVAVKAESTTHGAETGGASWLEEAVLNLLVLSSAYCGSGSTPRGAWAQHQPICLRWLLFMMIMCIPR